MESDLEHISSEMFDNVQFEEQLIRIKKASEEAQNKLDYDSAHDDHILLAIEVVERFLRKKHRICYGGQAINAYLPAKYKFYDPERSIPDYDFFTPSQEDDIRIIHNDLKRAGFTEISIREGMHEGTMKVYVDYIPVADLTVIDPKLYRKLSQREYRVDGISYLDASTLRMLMYLELSRPRGEVRRWEKVYERLMLFNEFVPIKMCHATSILLKKRLSFHETAEIIQFMIEKGRIFAGADLVSFYENAKKTKHMKWIFSQKKPILFLSPTPLQDAQTLLTSLSASSKSVSITSYHNKGVELIPSVHVLHRGKQPLVIIIEEVACHSYHTVSIKEMTTLRVATLDTLITLYFSLRFVQTKLFDTGSMECLANELVEISMRSRKNPEQFAFPFISLDCSGHQTSLPSLIRAKQKRITEKKEKGKQRTMYRKSVKRRLS